ncbi:possible membrane protein [Rhodococcus wratislaviensis]|uniref:Possible membrane protein n=1 Tax=Rhodococcus wratislaviensis TaxID=44752 RepID=A0A402CEG7_RHOWR|nr:possible membrane protein [Rhodococcus wratislaviensis]
MVDDPHALDESLLIEPRRLQSSWRGFLMSTPGRLSVLAVVLVVATLAAGTVTSAINAARQQEIETLRTYSEPLADAAQNLYSALSIADAAAAASFIFGGVEPAVVRERYSQAVGDASNALVTASNGVDPADAEALGLLSEVSRRFAEYTSLVSTARANDRWGNPIGITYLRSASSMMQGTILPLAHRLCAEQWKAVAATQARTTRLPVATFAVTATALVGLVLAHVYLTRKSRRLFNPGLIVAMLLMVTLLVWSTTAFGMSTSAGERARVDGAQPLSAIAAARILAQQARADEMLGVLQRGSDPQSEVDFSRHSTVLAGILDHHRNSAGGVADAAVAFEGWRSTHELLQQTLVNGDYPAAAAMAVDTGALAPTAKSSALDEALQSAINQLTGEEREATTEAYRSTSLLTVGAVVLGVLAGFSVGGGIWPRLNEYH